ncbi:histo-blood group ABO system transferase isoform X2 [Microcaecilia unicolor]|uniref:Histo-blood group ABO system transferase-like isoform X2 n=1 Tax=Microcaecilia unicolor TaxID=1415580 RepID=A0A6P7YKI9_9AMPH|nr:histo-blood group ABO system transferase-like isoform X2 [Microcaecilia unicolor]
MYTNQRINALGNRKYLAFSLVFLPFVFWLSWYTYSGNSWTPSLPFSCRFQYDHFRKDGSYLDHLLEIRLPRMNYSQPETMNPPRRDILVMTPWFAPIVWDGTFNIDILNQQFKQRNVRIGLTVFAIKKYVVFIQLFLETAEKFFMVGHKVNYYIMTDRPKDVPNVTLAEGRKVVVLEIQSYARWQDVSMRRMEMISLFAKEQFIQEVDFLVCVDVDMRFSDHVGVEILSDIFGTLHPAFYRGQRQQFTYERRPASQAYIAYIEGDFYYAGGFFGGTVDEVYKLTNQCHNAIMTDKANSIEALWHDESHLNKYFLNHKPTKILSPEYLWDNSMGVPEVLRKRRFVAVPKNHVQIRN